MSGHKIYGAADFRQRYRDGRMGSNPALATPEHGQQFYGLAVGAQQRLPAVFECRLTVHLIY